MSKLSKIIPDGKGGYNVHNDWTLGDEFMYQIGYKIFGFLILSFLFGLLMPIVCMFAFPLSDTRDRFQCVVVSIVASVIFLLDYWFGGIFWVFFMSNENIAEYINWFAALNASMLVVSLVILYFFRVIDANLHMSMYVTFYILIGLAVYFILFPIFHSILGPAHEPIGFLKEFFEHITKK